MLWLIWRGAVEADRRGYKIAFGVVFVIAGLTSMTTLMVLPPLFLAVVVLVWGRQLIANRRDFNLRKYAVETAVLMLISAGLVWWSGSGFISPAVEGYVARELQHQDQSALAEAAQAVNPFFAPSFSLSTEPARISAVVAEQPLYVGLVVAAVLSVCLTFLPWACHAARFRLAVWFLLITAGGVIFEFMFLVSDRWIMSRYLFVTLWPVLVMLACGSIGGIEGLLYSPADRARSARWVPTLAMLLPSLVMIAWAAPTLTGNLTHRLPDENQYHQAFEYVGKHLQYDDEVMTVTPPGSYWYLDRADYYARGPNPYVFQDSRGEMRELWTGSRWVSTAEDLVQVLSNDRRVWLVIDGARLEGTNSAAFKQQVFARMELLYRSEDVFVFLPASEPRQVPLEPESPLAAQLAGKVELTGYSLDEAALLAGSPAQLTLFWKVFQPLENNKVFVHLRDENGRTIVQADHVPSEALVALPTSTWHVGEVVPDVTWLPIPVDIPPGEYRLLVGMYNQVTQERLPVQHDTTGENAVLVTTLRHP